MSNIAQWLTGLNLEKYISAFTEAEIDFETLPDLAEEDLKEIGLPLGPRRKIWGAIQRLNGSAPVAGSVPVPDPIQDPEPPQQAPSSDAERRHLTVMFVDLVGSTQMATKMDPEDMRTVITDYQNTIAGIVTRYDGFVAKFMGDGVLCYFGWPRANEDDAERAVRAGLAMISAVSKMSGPDGTKLSTRVGIATGVVIVGDLIGSGATQEAAVVGETPNLAARLQGIAQPNQLVLPQETLRLLGNVFEMDSLGAHSLKGIADAVEAFSVVGESTRQSRFEAHQHGTLTPIVGREREIELMLECWGKAQSGRGQMIIVSGEAGIGKSRITRAVIDAIEQDPHTRINYQCSPYHTDSAFYPTIQQLTFAAGISPSDGMEARLDKLETLLGSTGEVTMLVANLLGIDGSSRYGTLDLTPAQQRTRTMQALVQLLVKQAESKPVLLVFEDLHWVDPTSLELLEIFLDGITHEKILILATTRPTFQHNFGGHPIMSRFSLNRLGTEQIHAIVRKLAGGKTLPAEVVEIIAKRTDGIPLFVEELTKTVLESGVLKVDGDRFVLGAPLNTLAIPNTLHDSLMARLDRLQPIKDVAQTAACIGREFKHQLLSQITTLAETELGSALEGLIKAELIFRRGLPPDATYIFKHALVRDAAYESLLKERRRSVHNAILNVLEMESDAAPEILAVHAEAAGLTDRAIDLWESASKAAIARPAFDEAISHLGRAMALIMPRLGDDDNTNLTRALSLQVQLGMTLLTRKGYTADETIAAFETALKMADQVGETPLRYSILYGLWIGMAARGQLAEAWPRAEELIEQAAFSPETAPLVVANRVAGASCWLMGDLSEAKRYLEIALTHYEPVAHAGLANRFGQDIGVAIHIFSGLTALTLGQTRRGWKHMVEAEGLAKNSGHVNTICYELGIRAIFGFMACDYAMVERCLDELLPITEEHNLVVWHAIGVMSKEILIAKKGDKSSIKRFWTAINLVAATKFKMFLPLLAVEMARSVLSLGLQDEAALLADMAQNDIMQTGENTPLPDLHRLQATLARAEGDTDAAEKYLNRALDIARQQGAKLWELRAAIDLARLWQEQGRMDDAISLLEPVHKSISGGDCPDDQALAQALLKACAK